MTKAAREAVRLELAPEVPRLGGELIAAVREQIPAYRGLHPGQTAEIAAIATWALRRIVELWVRGGGLTERDLARFRGIGAARARDGRPLTAVLRAYRVAAARAMDAVVGRGRGRLDAEDIAALARLWLASVDELSEALFAGYSAAAEQLATDRERARRELFDDLLAGRQVSPGALADRLARLDLALPARPALLVLDAEVDVAGAVLVTVRGRRTAALLDREPAPGARGCLISGYALADLPAAYRLATDALDTAPAYAFDGRPVLDEGDAQVLALLAARPSAQPDAVVRAVLGPLAEPRYAHLLDGLAAFLTAGSATAAASALRVHPQTLRYRLRRARELTGRDPRLPWPRLVLDVARHLHHIRQVP